MSGDHGVLSLDGHERVDEATVLCVEDGQSLQDRHEAVPGVRIGCTVLDDLTARPKLDGEGLVDECLSCREPAVEGGGSDLGPAGDFPHPDVEATLGEQLPSCSENPVAVLLRVNPEFPRQIRAHGPHFAEVDAPVH